METYRIAEFDFIRDGEEVDVMFGENYVGHFQLKPGMNRVEFIAECEDYFATEMVFA